jgi:hypothetical protein
MTLDLAPASRKPNPDEHKVFAASRDGRHFDRVDHSTETGIFQLPLP